MANEDITKKTLDEELHIPLEDETKKLQKEHSILFKKVNRLEEENVMLQELFHNANKELANMRRPALLVCDVIRKQGNNAIIKLPNGNRFLCYVAKEVGNLKSGDSVLVDQKSLNVVEKIELTNNYDVEKYVIIEKPKENWANVGGLKKEVEEVKEVIELPLKNPKLFEEVGITPPKGLLLYGPPGTGKTLLAKAVAHSTNATFIEVVGSELVQKFIGEGAKLVKDIFRLAREKGPTIIFIDEIDSLAAARMDLGTSGEREVNRTFMQLLAEVDGFKHLDNVKVIGATNRLDILDKALIRPGRLDRLIEVGLPNEEGREEIFKIHSKKMNLKKVKIKELIIEMEGLSGAEIKAVCTEAGYFAIREGRNHILHKDFLMAIDKIHQEEKDENYKNSFFG